MRAVLIAVVDADAHAGRPCVCHEGNDAISNLLRIARAGEAEAADKKKD
jgi:hypothetical protein